MKQSLLNNLQNIQMKKVIYPLLMSAFFLLILLVFVSASTFLYYSINRPFALDVTGTQDQYSGIHMSDYTLVAKKLGLTKIPVRSVPVSTEGSRQSGQKRAL